jgi:hypothetical protein
LTRSEQEIVGCEGDDAGAQDLEVGTGIAIDVATHPSVDAGLLEPWGCSIVKRLSYIVDVVELIVFGVRLGQGDTSPWVVARADDAKCLCQGPIDGDCSNGRRQGGGSKFKVARFFSVQVRALVRSRN